MLDWILKFLPFAIAGFSVYSTFTDYQEHQNQMSIEEAKIPILTQKLNGQRKKLLEIEDVKKNIAEYEFRIEEYNREIEDIKEKIPPLEEKVKVLDEIESMVEILNIKDHNFRPAYEREHANGVYYTNGIKFQGSGTYIQQLLLFERIAKSNRVLNVAEVKIKGNRNKTQRGRNQQSTRSSRHNMLTMNIILESFHYNDVKATEESDGSKKKKSRR